MTQSCNPDFFWSYAAWAQGKPGYGREILLNIALFVPLGYFLAAVLDGGAVKRFGLLAAGLSLIISCGKTLLWSPWRRHEWCR